ncbi:MAG: hypothetical protein JWN15_3278, partial [Firmicutes bacterium]|nr:hypothetical protein [Bacillota bacterium]
IVYARLKLFKWTIGWDYAAQGSIPVISSRLKTNR